MIRKIIKKLINIHLKRKVRFKKEGVNCNIRGLSNKISYPQNIQLGDNIYFGNGCDIDGYGEIIIRNGAIIAPNCTICTRNHYYDGPLLEAIPFDNKLVVKPVIIDEYVWICRNVIILPGVILGEGCIVGAGSVVTKSFPAYSIIAGNPAKLIKTRDRKRFLELKESGRFVYECFGHEKVSLNDIKEIEKPIIK